MQREENLNKYFTFRVRQSRDVEKQKIPKKYFTFRVRQSRDVEEQKTLRNTSLLE